MIKGYGDAAAKAVFAAFKQHMGPFIEMVCPDWLLHHIEIRRRPITEDPFEEQVEIRLILRPLGSVRRMDNPPGGLLK